MKVNKRMIERAVERSALFGHLKQNILLLQQAKLQIALSEFLVKASKYKSLTKDVAALHKLADDVNKLKGEIGANQDK